MLHGGWKLPGRPTTLLTLALRSLRPRGAASMPPFSPPIRVELGKTGHDVGLSMRSADGKSGGKDVMAKDQGFGQRKRPASANPPQKKPNSRTKKKGEKAEKSSIVKDTGPSSFWEAIRALFGR